MAHFLAGLGVGHCHVEAQGALSHRGPGGQDHQVGALEPAQYLVQVREPRHDRSGHPGQEVVHVRLLFLQVAVEDVPEGLEVALLGGVPDGVERVLGLPQRRVQVVGVAVAQLGDLGPGGDELSHGGGAGHDVGVVLGMDDVGVMETRWDR